MKFIGLLLWRITEPFRAMVILPLLLIAWLILAIVIFIWQTWEDAYGSQKY